MATALAVLVLAVVLALPAGSPGGPSLSQAAALALRPAVAAAPKPDPDNPGTKLGADVQGIYFPNWRSRGFRAVGQRRDRIGGREARTVFYEWAGRRLGYTIVGSPPLRSPAAKVTWRDGTELRTLTLDGREVVTWRRDGHTCVLSGASAGVLQRLAASAGA